MSIHGFQSFAPGRQLTIVLQHSDGTQDQFPVNHSYNDQQIEWVNAGSALNKIRKDFGVK